MKPAKLIKVMIDDLNISPNIAETMSGGLTPKVAAFLKLYLELECGHTPKFVSEYVLSLFKLEKLKFLYLSII